MSPPTIPATTTELLALCQDAAPALAWNRFLSNDSLLTGVWALVPGARVRVNCPHERGQCATRFYASLTTPGVSFEPMDESPDVLSALRLVAAEAAQSRDSYWQHVGRALRDLLDQPPTAAEPT